MINDSILIWITLGIFNLAIIILLRLTFSSVSLKEAMSEKSGPSNDTSYSRIAGMLGAVIVGCLVWGLGNVVLARAITAPTDVDTLLKGVWPFILSTSALFAPYAFNQIKDAMKPAPPEPEPPA